MTVDLERAERLAGKFTRRFPVKSTGVSGAISWVRGDRPPTGRFEPPKGVRGSRRNDGVNWCTWAYHAALGDEVTLRTIVQGRHKNYVLKATPEEARGWLEWHSYRPGFNLMREVARQHLDALNRAKEMAG